MKKIILSTVAISTLVFASDYKYDITFTLGGTIPQDDLKLEDHNNIGLRFGFQNQFVLENYFDKVEVGYERTKGADFENSIQDTNINRYSFHMLHHYSDYNGVIPYALGGIGYEDFSNEYNKVNDSIALNIGVGAKYFLDDQFSLRAEVRDHINLQQSIEQEIIYTFGLGYSFGQTGYKVNEEVTYEEPVIQAVVLDDDNDGVINENDSCPSSPKGVTVDSSGCEIDSDKDGVVDSLDSCPNSAIGTTVDETGCSTDSDNDGVLNSQDSCPTSPKGVTVDSSGCEIDSDKDGVVDSKDNCANTFEGFEVDGVGCPVKVNLHINFQTNKNNINEDYSQKLTKFANFMQMDKNSKIQIQGHTDSIGNENYNQKLSEKRAKSVMDRLIELGAPSENISYKGFGSTVPVASNDTVEGRDENRRVEAVIVK